ncbi:hypothetical protein HDV63DRAFT_77674 [Trichoderma sp. SZMC 28014]
MRDDAMRWEAKRFEQGSSYFDRTKGGVDPLSRLRRPSGILHPPDKNIPISPILNDGWRHARGNAASHPPAQSLILADDGDDDRSVGIMPGGAPNDDKKIFAPCSWKRRHRCCQHQSLRLGPGLEETWRDDYLSCEKPSISISLPCTISARVETPKNLVPKSCSGKSRYQIECREWKLGKKSTHAQLWRWNGARLRGSSLPVDGAPPHWIALLFLDVWMNVNCETRCLAETVLFFFLRSVCYPKHCHRGAINSSRLDSSV